jgi:prepilin-type N-terminal cleavage/methylation domain-containing protein
MSDRKRGFTLLELLVVLVVMAITAVAAAPAFLSDTRASAEQRTATAIADGLRRARQAARESGAPATFVLSMDGRYWITTRDSVLSGTIPLAAGSTLIGPGGERMECRFEASGPASPIAITAHGTTDVTVIVDEWSGEIGIGNAKAS